MTGGGAPKAARWAVLCGGRDGLTSQEKNRGQRKRLNARAGAGRGSGRHPSSACRSTGWESRQPYPRGHWGSVRCRTLSRERGAARSAPAAPCRRAKGSAHHCRLVLGSRRLQGQAVPPERRHCRQARRRSAESQVSGSGRNPATDGTRREGPRPGIQADPPSPPSGQLQLPWRSRHPWGIRQSPVRRPLILPVAQRRLHREDWAPQPGPRAAD